MTPQNKDDERDDILNAFLNTYFEKRHTDEELQAWCKRYPEFAIDIAWFALEITCLHDYGPLDEAELKAAAEKSYAKFEAMQRRLPDRKRPLVDYR